jgi:hypothetical protein
MFQCVLRRTAALAAILTFSAGLILVSGATFEQSERPLVVDFYALGADGTALPDLKSSEVTVRVNGRPRTIQSLRLVKQSELPSADPLTARDASLTQPFGTNNAAELGRSIVIVIEDESFRVGSGVEKPLRAGVAAFLGSLSPRDRVSLWTLPHGGMKVNLTANHDRVSQAMLNIGGTGDRITGEQAACRTRDSLEALDHLLSTLQGGAGPAIVLYMTGGMAGPTNDAPVGMAPGMCELRVDKFQRVGQMAAAARAHFYVVRVDDLGGASDGLENLAGVTGGTILALARAGNTGLVNIAKATASYYSAAVDSAELDLEGAVGLDVKVARPDVIVRSRPQVYLRKPKGISPQPTTTDDMMKTSAMYTDLQLRVTGYSSTNGDGRIRLIAAAEPVDPGVKLASLSAALYDSQGQMVVKAVATDTDLAAMPVLAAMAVNPGVFRLRVAAVDTSGRAGAADTEVLAEVVEAGALKLSSLVLGLKRDGKFTPKMQFSNEPVAIALMDFFGGKQGAGIGAILEVLNMAGEPIVTNRLSIEATQDPQRFTATGAVPVGALPPGDYIARITIGVDGGPYGRVIRAFRKVPQ